MTTKTEITELIFKSIEEFNQQNNGNIIKSADTKLFGFDSDLDSLGLVNLIISIEENINQKYNVFISLADERAMSQKNSPFRSVDAMVDYITLLLEEHK